MTQPSRDTFKALSAARGCNEKHPSLSLPRHQTNKGPILFS
jgi:hypothetical protein